jgi:hypothetical protein
MVINMSKTPEETAEEWAEDNDECGFARDAFLAGYKAARDQSPDATKWISVKDALPKPTTLVVVAMPFQPSCWRVQGDCQLPEDCHIELATLCESKFGFSWDF